MTNLGWTNAGGETAKRISIVVSKCKELGHKLEGQNRGMSGTWHETWCPICDYKFSEDSGD